MNTSSITDTDNTNSKTLFSQVIPESAFGKILFWGALPFIFLFLTIEVSVLSHSPFSPSLPFLAIVGGLSILRWRALALIGTCCALSALFFISEGKLKDYGILATFALDFLILYFSFLEVESILSGVSEFGKERVKELHQTFALLSQTQQEKEEQGRTLEEEIQRLKEEAEQRRIEKTQEAKRIALIQSEIELLTSQKEFFIDEAKKAKEIFVQIDELKTYIAALTGVQERLILEKELLGQEVESAQQENATLRKEAAEYAQEREQFTELKEQLAKIQSENLALNELQIKSENLQEQLIVALKENENLIEFQKRTDDLNGQKLATVQEEKVALENEQAALNARLSSLKAERGEIEVALISTQERVLTLQQRPLLKTQDLKALEGLYKQLRLQFEEKSQVLSSTRKELFETQGRVLLLQREEEERTYEPKGEEDRLLEALIARLVQEIESLEEEIHTLEELVSVQQSSDLLNDSI